MMAMDAPLWRESKQRGRLWIASSLAMTDKLPLLREAKRRGSPAVPRVDGQAPVTARSEATRQSCICEVFKI